MQTHVGGGQGFKEAKVGAKINLLHAPGQG